MYTLNLASRLEKEVTMCALRQVQQYTEYLLLLSSGARRHRLKWFASVFLPLLCRGVSPSHRMIRKLRWYAACNSFSPWSHFGKGAVQYGWKEWWRPKISLLLHLLGIK